MKKSLPIFLLPLFFFLFFFFLSSKEVLSYSQCFVNGVLVGDMNTRNDYGFPFLTRGKSAGVEFAPLAGVVANNEVFFRPGGTSWLPYSTLSGGRYFLTFNVAGSVTCSSWWTNTMYRYLRDGVNHYCNDLMTVYDEGVGQQLLNLSCLTTSSGCIYTNTSARRIGFTQGYEILLTKGTGSEVCSNYRFCINNGLTDNCGQLGDWGTGQCRIYSNPFPWPISNSISARLIVPAGYNPQISTYRAWILPYLEITGGGYCGGQIIDVVSTPTPTAAPTSTPMPTSTPGGPTVTPLPTGTPVPLPTCYYWQVEANNGSRRRLSPIWHFCVNSVISRWFQTQDGDVLARGDITSIIPSGAASRYLSIAGTGGSPGVVSYGNNIDLGTEGLISSTNWQTRKDYLGATISFDYLRNRLEVETDNDTFTGTMPAQDGIYYSSTSRNLSGNFPAGRKIIIFVNGDVTVENNIVVPTGSFFALISRGSITFSATTPVTQAQGFYLTDGTISTGAAAQQLIGQGSFIGWGGFNFQRNLSDNTTPGELFVSRPDFFVNAPSDFLFTPSFFQEVEP